LGSDTNSTHGKVWELGSDTNSTHGKVKSSIAPRASPEE